MAPAVKISNATSAVGDVRKAWRLPLALLLVLGVLGGAGYFAYQKYSAAAAQEREEAMRKTATGIAADIARAVAEERKRFAGVFEGSELARLLEAGNAEAIDEEERRIEAIDESILKARVLATGVSEPDYSTDPPLSYAALEMLRASEKSGETPLPEVHLLGQDNQHMAMVWRITDGDALRGHLLLALKVSTLPAAMARVSVSDGYVELLQRSGGKPLVLANGGIGGAREGPPALQLEVRGTPWRLAFWPSGRLAPPRPLADVPPWAFVGVAALLLALAVMVALRRRRAALAEAEEEEEARIARRAAAKRPAARPAQSGAGARASGESGEADALLDESASSEGIIVEEEPSAVEVPAGIFRAYDIRGIVGKTLTPEIVREIGRAIGSEANDRAQQTLVVGRDGRNSGPEIQQALVEGLRAAGRDVIDVGRVPTPVLYFATQHLNTGSGVMVTGSHNPPDYNGLKIMLAGDTLFGDEIRALHERIVSGQLVRGDGRLQTMEVVDEYVRRICEDIPVALGNSFRVVVDCGNGVAGEVAPKLLRALGHDVVELYCDVDGNFPNHHPDPSDPKNLADLIGKVKDEGAEIGFAFDGDGDRLGVVDPKGNIVWADRQMMLYARDVLSRNAGAEIIFDVKCSNRLAKVIKQLGGKPVMWRTGHSFIKSKLKETGAPLAGEMSGHIFFNDRWYGFDDAIYASARLLEILMGLKRAPAQVFSKLPAGVSTPELRVDVEEGEQVKLVEKLVKAEGFSQGKRSTIDGLRVDYADGWGLVRASNTTPSLVMRFEADDDAALSRIEGEFRDALQKVKPGIELPF